MFSVSSSPELKSAPKTSKAASRTTRPSKMDKSADSAAVPSRLNLRTKSKKKEKESKAVEKRKRQRAAPREEAEGEGDEGLGLAQSDYSLRGDQSNATGESLSFRVTGFVVQSQDLLHVSIGLIICVLVLVRQAKPVDLSYSV